MDYFGLMFAFMIPGIIMGISAVVGINSKNRSDH